MYECISRIPDLCCNYYLLIIVVMLEVEMYPILILVPVEKNIMGRRSKTHVNIASLQSTVTTKAFYLSPPFHEKQHVDWGGPCQLRLIKRRQWTRSSLPFWLRLHLEGSDNCLRCLCSWSTEKNGRSITKCVCR
jgi:hypothetical protein